MNLMRKPPLGQRAEVTARDPAYLSRVRTLPCAIGYHFDDPCEGPVAAHHVFHDRHGNEKTPDSEAIPLCWAHHQGPNGIHENKREWRARFGADHDFTAWTQDRLGV